MLIHRQDTLIDGHIHTQFKSFTRYIFVYLASSHPVWDLVYYPVDLSEESRVGFPFTIYWLMVKLISHHCTPPILTETLANVSMSLNDSLTFITINHICLNEKVERGEALKSVLCNWWNEKVHKGLIYYSTYLRCAHSFCFYRYYEVNK